VTNRTEDWDTGFVAYEVKVTLINKRTRDTEAEGIGSCNSRERRYKSQDAANVANTLLKMAKKRALIDATLSATGCSSIFTQDIEDMDASEPQHAAQPRQSAAQHPAPEPVHQTLALNFETDETDYLRECLDWIKKVDPRHPQKRDIVDELNRRAAELKAKSQAPAQEESAPATNPPKATDEQRERYRIACEAANEAGMTSLYQWPPHITQEEAEKSIAALSEAIDAKASAGVANDDIEAGLKS
jgi:hypothetical protein